MSNSWKKRCAIWTHLFKSKRSTSLKLHKSTRYSRELMTLKRRKYNFWNETVEVEDSINNGLKNMWIAQWYQRNVADHFPSVPNTIALLSIEFNLPTKFQIRHSKSCILLAYHVETELGENLFRNHFYFVFSMCPNSSTIQLSSSNMRNCCEVSNMHLMPCNVQRNGEGKVYEHFQGGVKDELNRQQKGLRRNCNIYNKCHVWSSNSVFLTFPCLNTHSYFSMIIQNPFAYLIKLEKIDL